jgi:hypothetical protein
MDDRRLGSMAELILAEAQPAGQKGKASEGLETE